MRLDHAVAGIALALRYVFDMHTVGIALSIAFALTLAGCSGTVAGEEAPSEDRVAPDDTPNGAEDDEAAGGDDAVADAGSKTVLSGAEQFRLTCAACHGLEAEGTTVGPELRHPVRAYARWVVRNGRSDGLFEGSEMLPFSQSALDDDALARVLDHLASFPQPETGEGLYLDYCGNCHGADAAGGVVGQEIHDAEYDDVLDQVREGEGADAYAEREEYMPRLGPGVLSNDELRAIADHLATLRE